MNCSPSRRRRSMESDVAFETPIPPPTTYLCADSSSDDLAHLIRRDALLLQCVAIANRHRAILHRLTIDGEAEWSADFVLPPIPAPDGARLIIEYRERRP